MNGLYQSFQIGVGVDDGVQVHTTQALHDGGDITVGQGQQFHHFGIDAVFVEVFLLGEVHVGILLWNHADDGSFLLGLLHQRLTGVAPDEDRSDHTGEKHQVSDGQDRSSIGCLIIDQFLEIAFDISYHLKSCILILFTHISNYIFQIGCKVTNNK